MFETTIAGSLPKPGWLAETHKLWPQWKGDLFIGGLSSQALIRVDVDGTNARKGDQWPMGQRIPEPEEGPDGAIWLLEDGHSRWKGQSPEADTPRRHVTLSAPAGRQDRRLACGFAHMHDSRWPAVGDQLGVV